MLNKFGFSREASLTDNGLRYILWRSYENLKKPADKHNALDVANDIAKRYELKVGNFVENLKYEDVAKEYIKLFKGAKDLDIRILNSPDDVYDFAIEYGETEEKAKEFAEIYSKNNVGGAYVGESNKILIFASKNVATPLSDMFHEHTHYAIEQLGGVDMIKILIMDEKMKNSQERKATENLKRSEPVQDEELPNTQSDEEELNSIAEMIRERLDAKEEINKILTKFKIK